MATHPPSARRCSTARRQQFWFAGLLACVRTIRAMVTGSCSCAWSVHVYGGDCFASTFGGHDVPALARPANCVDLSGRPNEGPGALWPVPYRRTHRPLPREAARPLSTQGPLSQMLQARWPRSLGNHYGQIAEGVAAAGCIAGLQPELCVIAAAAAGITSEVQNATSSCPSVAGGLIDLLGLAPGLQVAGADFFGLLGAGGTAGNVFSGIVGGSAIVGGPAAVQLARQQHGATQSSCGCQ
jgi:hypothetical protein